MFVGVLRFFDQAGENIAWHVQDPSRPIDRDLSMGKVKQCRILDEVRYQVFSVLFPCLFGDEFGDLNIRQLNQRRRKFFVPESIVHMTQVMKYGCRFRFDFVEVEIEAKNAVAFVVIISDDERRAFDSLSFSVGLVVYPLIDAVMQHAVS